MIFRIIPHNEANITYDTTICEKTETDLEFDKALSTLERSSLASSSKPKLEPQPKNLFDAIETSLHHRLMKSPAPNNQTLECQNTKNAMPNLIHFQQNSPARRECRTLLYTPIPLASATETENLNA